MGKFAVVTVLAVSFLKCLACWLVPIVAFVTSFALSLDEVEAWFAILLSTWGLSPFGRWGFVFIFVRGLAFVLSFSFAFAFLISVSAR